MLKLIITYCSWGAIHIPGKPAREDSLCGKRCYLIYSARANFHIGVEGNDVTHHGCVPLTAITYLALCSIDLF